MNRRLQIPALLIGILIVAVLVVPFFVPIPPLAGVESEIARGGLDSRYLTIQYPGTDGIALHYIDAGSGDIPVVMLHSEYGDLFEWETVIQTLSANTRAIAYDRPPSGLSEHILPEFWSGANPYTTNSAVDMLIAFLDELQIERVVVVASGKAARVALEAALQHPDRVTQLVLVAPDITPGSPTLAS